jgi:hypothetical protein
MLRRLRTKGPDRSPEPKPEETPKLKSTNLSTTSTLAPQPHPTTFDDEEEPPPPPGMTCNDPPTILLKPMMPIKFPSLFHLLCKDFMNIAGAVVNEDPWGMLEILCLVVWHKVLQSNNLTINSLNCGVLYRIFAQSRKVKDVELTIATKSTAQVAQRCIVFVWLVVLVDTYY